jgi:hypothetical protein
MNVDLDIHSKWDLQPLVTALGEKIREMYVGRVRRTYEAHLELAWRRSQTPTSIILGFCKLIEALPRSERKLWDSAKTRSFDIGIDAPAEGRFHWSAVGQDAVRAAADVGAQIAITVYGPMKIVKRSLKSMKAASSK